MIALVRNTWIKILQGSKKTKAFVILFVVMYVFLLGITLIQVKEEMVTPAFFTPVSSVIEIEEENETGNIYTVAVFVNKDISLFQKLLVSMNFQITSRAYNPVTALSRAEETRQGEVMKEVSINNSIISAYLEAKKDNDAIEVSYAYLGQVIHTITPNITPTELLIGDVIKQIDGVEVTEENFVSLVQSKDTSCGVAPQSFQITVQRRTQTLTFTVQKTAVTASDNTTNCLLGIGTYASFHITEEATFPSFTIQSSRTLGPSGGLMQTLAVYNSITPTDITKGLRIAGSGTIDIYGNVGNIGSVGQKIVTAQFYGADIFFVPVGNYEEALEMYQNLTKEPNFALVPVATLEDAIQYLASVEVA